MSIKESKKLLIDQKNKIKKKLVSISKLPWKSAVRLEITTVLPCTVGCSYCPQHKILANYEGEKRLEFSNFKKILDKVPQNVEIVFSGFAEPYLNPDCTNMLVYAREQGHKVQMYTTLIGMTLSDIETIKHIKFTELVVHLPSTENLEKNFSWNDEYLTKLKTILQSDIKNMRFMCFGTIPQAVRATLSTDKLKRTKQSGKQGNSRAGNLSGRKYSPVQKQGAISCKEGRLSMNILLPNGQVQLCCMDWGLQHNIGNLKNQTYDSLFQSQAYMNVLKGLYNEDSDILCRQCEVACAETWVTRIKEKILQNFYSMHNARKYAVRH